MEVRSRTDEVIIRGRAAEIIEILDYLWGRDAVDPIDREELENFLRGDAGRCGTCGQVR